MDIGIIAARYAKALMEYAQTTGSTEAFYAEMRMLDESFRRHPELRDALDNPVLTVEKKRRIICIACVGDKPVRAELERFVSLVMKNGREAFLHFIALAFIDRYRKTNHIGVAKLTTAVPVSPRMEGYIRERSTALLHARDMELQTEVNPDIEGGFIFDVNDYRLDASIATQLRRVKQQFVELNRRIV